MRPTALGTPTLDPTIRTRATAKTIAWLDREANRVLSGCRSVINVVLWAAVWAVLAVESARGIAGHEASGWRDRKDGRYGKEFYCGWCGSVTPEGNHFQLTCCAMACEEYWRRTEPALYEQWTGRSA